MADATTRRPSLAARPGWRGAIVFVMAAWLALAGALAGPRHHADAAWGATVGVDLLNVRSEPGTWAEVVAVAGYGEWVDIWDGPTWDGWYQVGYGGIGGWVFGDHLSMGGAGGWTADPTVSEPATPARATTPDTIYTAWVGTDALAIRADPWTSATMLDTRYWGDEVTVVGGAVDGYVPIDHWSGRAWVYGGYLRSEATGDSAGPTASKWIDVDRSSGIVTLYEGGVAVLEVWGAMGWEQTDDGFYATANGTYYVYDKHDDLTWTDWGNAWIRYYVAFDPARLNGFHSYSLEQNGTYAVRYNDPTGGCIALDIWAAEYLYEFATIGTRVEIHW